MSFRVRARFWAMYALLGMCAVALGGATYAGIKQRPAAASTAKAAGPQAPKPSQVEQSAGALEFARELAGVVNATSTQNSSSARIDHVICVMGSPDEAVCSFWAHTPDGVQCHLADVFRSPSTGEISVGNGGAGRVPLPLDQCTALNALKWVGQQQ